MKRQRIEDLEKDVPAEVKYWDNPFSTNTSVTGTVDMPLVGLTQGTSESTRIGGKINICGFGIKGHVTGIPQTGAAPLADLVRILVVLDKQANGAAPVVSDILQSAQIISFLLLDNQDRFEILAEKYARVDVTAWGGSTVQTLSAILPIEIDLKVDIPVHIADATGAQAKFKSNQICVLYISHSAESSFSYMSRTLYTDA